MGSIKKLGVRQPAFLCSPGWNGLVCAQKSCPRIMLLSTLRGQFDDARLFTTKNHFTHRSTSYIVYGMIDNTHSISSAQCRAGRALLELTQEQLAEKARVARPTIADFERNARRPIDNNILSIIRAFETSGISFITEDDQCGVGVRFRHVKLEYSKSLKLRGDDVVIHAKYSGVPVDIIIPRELVDDHNNVSGGLSAEERLCAVQDIISDLCLFAELKLQQSNGPQSTEIVITSMEFQMWYKG